MNRIYFILIIFLIVSACKEDDQDLNPDGSNNLDNVEIRWEDNFHVLDHDTIDAPIHFEQYVAAIPVDDNYSFEWNINNDTIYTSRYFVLTFHSNGIKDISLKARYAGKERIFTFYVNVYGFLITNMEKESYGYFISESENLHRTVFTREDMEMTGYEFNNYELLSRKTLDIDPLPYTDGIAVFSRDINGYINLWNSIEFFKFDKHADLIFSNSSLSYSDAGNIYISSENRYYLIGTSSYNTIFYHFDQNGGNYSHETLHENDGHMESKDGLMLNDSSYILIIENTDNNTTSLFQKYLNSNEENVLMTLPENYNRITRTNEGYILYEIGEQAIAYFNQNLEMVWNLKIDNLIRLNRLKFREFENSFLLINNHYLISISKSGEINFIRDYYDGARYKFKSISESSNYALILADILNINDHIDETYASIMFIMDEDGRIIE